MSEGAKSILNNPSGGGGGGGTVGPGTTGTMPVFTSATTIGDSQITQASTGTTLQTLNGSSALVYARQLTGSISPSGAFRLDYINPTIVLANNQQLIGRYLSPTITQTSNNTYHLGDFIDMETSVSSHTGGINNAARDGLTGSGIYSINSNATGLSTGLVSYVNGNISLGIRSWAYATVGSSRKVVASSNVAGLNGSAIGTAGYFKIINDASTSGSETTTSNQFPAVTAALIADSGDTSSNILNLLSNGTSRMTVSDAGVVNLSQLTASKTVVTDSSKNLVSGEAAPTYTTVSSNVTLVDGSYNFVDTTAARSLALPNPATSRKIKFVDKSGLANTNNITFTRFGSEKIQRVAASYIYSTNDGAGEFVSDGTDWYIF